MLGPLEISAGSRGVLKVARCSIAWAWKALLDSFVAVKDAEQAARATRTYTCPPRTSQMSSAALDMPSESCQADLISFRFQSVLSVC